MLLYGLLLFQPIRKKLWQQLWLHVLIIHLGRFLIESRKTKSKVRKGIEIANGWSLLEARETRVSNKSQLVFVVHLIGWEDGASFVDQSRCVVKQNHCDSGLLFENRLLFLIYCRTRSLFSYTRWITRVICWTSKAFLLQKTTQNTQRELRLANRRRQLREARWLTSHHGNVR